MLQVSNEKAVPCCLSRYMCDAGLGLTVGKGERDVERVACLPDVSPSWPRTAQLLSSRFLFSRGQLALVGSTQYGTPSHSTDRQVDRVLLLTELLYSAADGKAVYRNQPAWRAATAMVRHAASNKSS